MKTSPKIQTGPMGGGTSSPMNPDRQMVCTHQAHPTLNMGSYSTYTAQKQKIWSQLNIDIGILVKSSLSLVLLNICRLLVPNIMFFKKCISSFLLIKASELKKIRSYLKKHFWVFLMMKWPKIL